MIRELQYEGYDDVTIARLLGITEEEVLWGALEEDGLLPRQVTVLPECASYLGTDKRHGTTFWRGVSGRMFELM